MKRLILALAALLAAPLSAHDFWIEPLAYEVAAGDPVALRLRVGEHFAGKTLTPAASSIAGFQAVDPAGARPVPPAAAGIAGLVTARHAGLLALGYESRPAAITLDAATFETYLREEGLERVLAQRAAEGRSGAPARELFARSAKSLVRVEGAVPTGTDPSTLSAGLEPLGLPLEFLPAADPYTLRAGAVLDLELRYRGRPAAGVQVVALPETDPSRAQRLRTDAAGRVTVALDHPGAWLVKAVHMDAAPDPATADWMSWWASLTFAIPQS